MHKQSNAPLYVVAGCVAAIAIIVAVVRANAPPETAGESRSALSDLRLTGLGAAASASAPAPAGSEEGRVQMLPITVEGKQGVLVRYRSDVIFEPVQRQVASNIMQKMQKEAEKTGVEYVVIMAVGPGGNADGGAFLAAQTHTIVYKRLMDGSWVEVDEPAGIPGSSASTASGAPAASGSTPAASGAPAASNVPLFITH